MRQIGTLSSQTDAARFAAYLTTEGVSAHTEEDGQEWIVWVHDENQVVQARDAYAEYKQNPEGEAYQGVVVQAEQMLREKAKQRESAAKNVVQMQGRWKKVGGTRRQPLITTLIVISVIVFLATNLGKNWEGTPARTLLFIDAVGAQARGDHYLQDRLFEVRRGELWRILTPIFIHGGMMHIAFNMIMLYQLGNPIEERRGTWNLGWMVVFIGATSTLAQCLAPAAWGGGPLMGGMSGVVYGLLGYSWMKTRFQPELGIFVPQSTVTFLIVVMFVFMTPIAKNFGFNVANWAHGVGLLAGMAVGYAPVLFRFLAGK
jgi:GlpG protein